MAKEITHILIAHDVLGKLKCAGQPMLAQVIQRNVSAYYLGSIIPDALFYDLPPFRLNPKKHLWISRALHHKDRELNDQKAVGLFSSISAAPHMWSQKMAFSAGIITHTVADRIFHNLIDYYNNAWREEGSDAMATHREIETLIDMALLKPRDMHPRQFCVDHYIALDGPTECALYHFYLAYLTENARGPNHSLVNVLKKAINQQRFFLKLFASRHLYHITKISNNAVSNRLQAWHGLFYPDTDEAQGFQFPNRMRANPPGDKNPFDPGGLTPYTDAASSEAIRCINLAVRSLA
ncbi:MAG: zinc dependent phospholipase C family protein [Deltaproteobacteria bacterium]|nr:zinc dependent phospholipase C family protein [Deltaproteobacteria bacterium]